MSDSSTFSDTEQTEDSPVADPGPERAEVRLAEASAEVPEPDYSAVPAADSSRGQVSFAVWSTAVAQLLELQDLSDHELAGVGVTGAFSKAYQVEELTPRSFVEGIRAAVAFAEAAPEPEDTRTEADEAEVERTEAARESDDPEAAAAEVAADQAAAAFAEDEAPEAEVPSEDEEV